MASQGARLGGWPPRKWLGQRGKKKKYPLHHQSPRRGRRTRGSPRWKRGIEVHERASRKNGWSSGGGKSPFCKDRMKPTGTFTCGRLIKGGRGARRSVGRVFENERIRRGFRHPQKWGGKTSFSILKGGTEHHFTKKKALRGNRPDTLDGGEIIV